MKRFFPYLHPEHYTSIGHQIFFLVITCTILSVMLYCPFVHFRPSSLKPFLQPVTQETVAAWGAEPVQVQVGMHITDFLKFDTVKNEFVVNAFIWFSYDPNVVKQETIDAFYFTKGEITQKSEPAIKHEDGRSIALYTIRVQFSTILNYHRFPLDDHRLFLNLANSAVTANQLVYQVDPQDFIISPNIYVSGWRVVGHEVVSGYAPVQLGHDKQLLQTKTVFSLDLSKGDLRQLALIFLPLLFLFYLGLFAFSIRDITIAMTLPLATISGLFAYSFVIQILAPAVGYMMLSDYLFLFFLFATFAIFLVRALTVVPEQFLSRTKLKKIEGLTVVVLQVALVMVWYWLVF